MTIPVVRRRGMEDADGRLSGCPPKLAAEPVVAPACEGVAALATKAASVARDGCG